MATEESRINIDREGVHIELDTPLGETVSKDISWDHISNIQVDEFKRLDAHTDNNPPLPIYAEVSGLMIGGKDTPDQTALESYDFSSALERETGIKFDTESKSVDFNHNHTDKANYAEFVRFLVEEGYITESDLPHATQHSRSNYVINTEPEHKDDKEMSRPTEVAEGIFIDTNMPKDQKKAMMIHLYEEFVE